MSGIVGNNVGRGSGTIKSAVVGADAITGDEIADDAIDSEHYTDGSIDTAHIADNQITLAKMAGGTDGNIISYDASGDPVAIATGSDGQVLTSTGAGSPPAFEAAAGGFAGGLLTSNGTDTAHDIDIAIGSYPDYGRAALLTLSSVLTKQIDAGWAVGDDAGGLDTGSVAANTIYGLYLIRRSDTGVVDAMFSLDSTESLATGSLPTNYDQHVLIAAVLTDASSNLYQYRQAGSAFVFLSDVAVDVADNTMTSNTYETATLSVPALAMAYIYIHVTNVTSTSIRWEYVVKTKDGGEPTDQNKEAQFHMIAVSNILDTFTVGAEVLVDASKQVEYKTLEATGTATMVIRTKGFRMNTGRFL